MWYKYIRLHEELFDQLIKMVLKRCYMHHIKKLCNHLHAHGIISLTHTVYTVHYCIFSTMHYI